MYHRHKYRNKLKKFDTGSETFFLSSDFFKVHRNRILMVVPRACNTRFLKIVFDSAEIFDFRACSASDEIRSAFAQCAMKFVPRMLSMDVHVKTVHILPLDEHFLICSVCDEIVSSYAQCAIKSYA